MKMLMKVNNKISLQSHYLKTIKKQYILFIDRRLKEVVLVFERNNAGLKNLSSFV
jgi:hypothetical protein